MDETNPYGSPAQATEQRLSNGRPKCGGSSGRQRRRWYQLTIGRVLGATVWMAIFFALVSLSRWWKVPDRNPPLLFAISAALVLCPIAALGNLFGHPVRGLLAGILLIIGLALALYIGVNAGWINLGD
jgi:hypothetical protein